MTIREFFKALKREAEELLEEGYIVGIRFEELERKSGDVITETSRHNLDREDERDFPEYGTEEYFELFEFVGVSAYDVESFERVVTPPFGKENFLERDAQREFLASKAYIIYGDDTANEDDVLDEGEIVMVEPTVHKRIF